MGSEMTAEILFADVASLAPQLCALKNCTHSTLISSSSFSPDSKDGEKQCNDSTVLNTYFLGNTKVAPSFLRAVESARFS